MNTHAVILCTKIDIFMSLLIIDMTQEIVIRYEYIFREFLYANDQSFIYTMHIESLMSSPYKLSIRSSPNLNSFERKWKDFLNQNIEGGSSVSVHVCICTCVCIVRVYFLSFTNANILAENLQTLHMQIFEL